MPVLFIYNTPCFGKRFHSPGFLLQSTTAAAEVGGVALFFSTAQVLSDDHTDN